MENSPTQYARSPAGLRDLTSWATRLKFDYPVFCTQAVWNDCVAWPEESEHEARIYGLLDSASMGITRAMTDGSDATPNIFFDHFRLPSIGANSAKVTQLMITAHLDTDKRPWLRIWDPSFDQE